MSEEEKQQAAAASVDPGHQLTKDIAEHRKEAEDHLASAALLDKAEATIAKSAAPPSMTTPVDPRSLPPPEWFDRLVGRMFFLYPDARPQPQTVPSWWLHLALYPQHVLAHAFSVAPQNVPANVVPSAELVRRLAEAIAKQGAA
jgi:hypothetical protein